MKFQKLLLFLSITSFSHFVCGSSAASSASAPKKYPTNSCAKPGTLAFCATFNDHNYYKWCKECRPKGHTQECHPRNCAQSCSLKATKENKELATQ